MELSQETIEAIAEIVYKKMNPERPKPENPKEYLSMSAAAKELGTNDSQFRKWVDKGRLPAPTHHPNNSFFASYHRSELPALSAAIAKARDIVLQDRYSRPGMFFFAQLSTELDVPEPTVRSWVNRGEIPEAAHKYNGHKYWTQEQLDELKLKKAEYFATRKAGE